MKILLAEDDLISRMMLSHMLEGWGHQVVAVENGMEAMVVYRSLRPEVVISDWAMPRMSGLEFCRRIRNDADSAYSYFILLTAREGSRESLEEAYEAGVDDFLAKPCHPQDLQSRLRVAERVSRLEAALEGQIAQLAQANEKMRNDLKAAARIQEALLPSIVPVSEGWEFAWSFVPCEELAGDFLNVFRIDDRRVGLFVLDVSGHGVAAALMSVTLSRLLSPSTGRSLLFRPRGDGTFEPVTPSGVMQLLNDRFQITDSTDGQYFTICYGILDTVSGSFRYSVAGHPAGLMRKSDDSCVSLKGGDLPIGFLSEVDYHEWEVTIEPGEQIYLFSDGLTEISRADGAEFGLERLGAYLCSQSDGVGRTVGAIVQEALRWHGKTAPEDDVSVLAFGRNDVKV